jgi:choline dehydrogenase
MGVKDVVDLPGVGENLQDHPNIMLEHFSKHEMPDGHGYSVEGGLFVRSSASGRRRASPDIQFMGLQRLGRANEGLQGVSIHGLIAVLTQPHSRGNIRLRTANPTDSPKIQANYLQRESDRRRLLEGLSIARELAQQESMKAISDGEIYPGGDVKTERQQLDYLRWHVGTTHHHVGTCKMGHDSMSVVNSRLKVHGVEGLRVADASIMPSVVNGNTNAACIMIGEKAADMIKKA